MPAPCSDLKRFNIRHSWGLVVFGLGALSGAVPCFAGTTVTTPYAGMTRYSADNVTVNGRSVDYEVVVLETLDSQMSFYLTPSNGATAGETNLQTTRNFASAHTTELAINTHFFSTSGSTANVTGIAASNGDVYSPFETSGGLAALNISMENFAETVTGVSGGTTFSTSSSVPYTAVATNSMLRRDGAIGNIGATDFRARTQIGVTRNGSRMMFFASSSGMTEQEGAEILVNQFGAFHVHGLDGGGSTTMVLRTAATTQSVIAKEGFSERSVGANLGVQAGPYVAGIPDVMSWDADSVTPGIQQGGGTWDFTSNNWQAAGVNRPWANPKAAVLGAGGGALIVLGGRVAVSDFQSEGGYTIGTADGPSMTLLGNVTTTGSATTINAPLGSSTSFTKRGEQTLVLGASARISMLNVSEGTIDLSGQTLTVIDPLTPMTLTGGTVQNGSIVFTDADPELAAPSGNSTLNVDFTAAKITKTGAGNVTLGGVVSWSGALVISGGTLRLSSAATLPTTTVTISSGLLDLDGASGTVGLLNLGGSVGASALATGSGTLTLGNTVTFNATNNPQGATMSGKLALSSARTFAVGDSSNADADLHVSADISGAFTLTKTQAGTMVLSGANSFTALSLNEGTIRSGASDTLPNGLLTVSRGLVDLAGFSDTVGAVTMGSIADVTPEIRTGTGVLTLGGGFTYSATNNGLGALVSGRINLGSATRTFTIGDSANAAVDTRIEAEMEGATGIGLTKAGAGTLELAGALTIPGTFTVNNGQLKLSGSNSTLAAVTLGGVANAAAILDTGATTLSHTGILAFSNGNNGLGATLRGRLDTGLSARNYTINNSTNTNVDLRIEAELQGSGGFVKGGAGTLELAGSNSLTGPISATAGILMLSHPNAMGNSSLLSFNGTASLNVTGLPDETLVIDRGGLTVSGLGSLTGNVALNSGRLLSPGSGVLAISGNLSGSGGTVEVKVGTGNGTITSGGAVNLGGTLKVNMGGTLSGTQSIPIITGTSVVGSFSSLQLPTPPAGTVYSISVTSNQVLFNVSPGTVAQSWLGSKGLPLNSSFASDLDGDGNSLLAEYALGGEPGIPEANLTDVDEQGGVLQISFLWNTLASDVNCIVEGSGDLTLWTTLLSKTQGAPWTGAASFVQGPTVNGLAPVTVNDTTTLLPRFIRVRLIKP